ncbi:unnamed protein product [Ectocarpus sp. 12 AP-2014]
MWLRYQSWQKCMRARVRERQKNLEEYLQVLLQHRGGLQSKRLLLPTLVHLCTPLIVFCLVWKEGMAEEAQGVLELRGAANGHSDRNEAAAPPQQACDASASTARRGRLLGCWRLLWLVGVVGVLLIGMDALLKGRRLIGMDPLLKGRRRGGEDE